MTLHPTLKRTLQVLGAVLCIAVLGIAAKLRYDGQLRFPSYDEQPPTLEPLARPAVLVFSKTNGFIHREAIPAAQALLQHLGQAHGWTVYQTDNAAIHNAADLARFDAIVWNNVSGDVLLPAQREALQQYLAQGGGFVGLHATGGDPHYDWEWQPQSLIRAQFIGHPMWPQFQQATLRVQQPADAIVQHLNNHSDWVDEWYSFRAPPTGVQVLLDIDEHSYQPEVLGIDLRMGAQHPLVWKHCIGKGRVFYSALGHLAATYADPRYQQVLAQAITWAMHPNAKACP